MNETPTTLRRFSFAVKTQLIALAVVLFVLVCAFVSFTITNFGTFRRNLVDKIDSAARVIATNSVVAMEFEDRNQAEKILTSLSSIDDVLGAVAYDRHGRRFVAYSKYSSVPFERLDRLERPTEFDGAYLYLRTPIANGSELLGTIRVVASTARLHEQILDHLMVLLIVSAFILTAGGILGARLAGGLVKPILRLSDTAALISKKGDYSIRVVKQSEDEIGTLYESFNRMLDRIESQDSEIRKLNEELEEKVRRRTRDLAAAKEQAEEARKRAELADSAKSSFLANMSHEIRTPMNAVIGFADLLQATALDIKQRDYLDSIKTGSRNLLKLINDILDLSKIEAGEMELQYEAVHLISLFEEIRQVFSPAVAQKGLRFIIDAAADIPPTLLMDEVRVRQVLLNLIGNAIKFTDQGHVRLSARRSPLSDSTGIIDLIISVTDTGIGIPMEHHEKIFEAFKQQGDLNTKKYGGTGLGLTITRRLVEIMGGTISVRSIVEGVERGSVFEVVIPNMSVVEADAPKESPRLVSEPLTVFGEATVLVADDVESNRRLIKEFLAGSPLHIIEAANGREAVDLAGLYHPDVILMDVRMPQVDGLEATRMLKHARATERIPIIAITACVMREDSERIAAAGCDGYVSEPVSRSELIRELSRFLSPDRHVTEPSDPWETLRRSDLDSTTRARLPALLATLQSECMDSWNEIQRVFVIGRVELFAVRVAGLGREYNMDVVTQWGQQLRDRADAFDMEKLPGLLSSFPDLVRRVAELKDGNESPCAGEI